MSHQSHHPLNISDPEVGAGESSAYVSQCVLTANSWIVQIIV